MKRAMIGCLGGLRALAQDRFDRPDGLIGTAELGGTWENTVGTFSVVSNKAKGTSTGLSIAVLPVDLLNYTISVDATWNTNDVVGIVARSLNSSNNNCMRFLAVGGTLTISKIISGTFTTLQTVSYAWTSGATHNMKFVCSGNDFYGYIDDVLQISATDDNATKTYTRVGIRVDKTGAVPGATIGNFLVMG